MDIVDVYTTASFFAGLLDSEVEIDNFSTKPEYIVNYKWRKFIFHSGYNNLTTNVDIVYSGIIDRCVSINISSSAIINPKFNISEYFIKCINSTPVNIQPVIKKLL